MGLVTPTLIGFITKHDNTFAGWQLVFSIGAAVYFGGNLFYVVLVKGEIQDWNNAQGTGAGREEEEEEEEEMQERKSLKGEEL